MILALDSNGNVSTALLQANSNSSVMELYFHHFIQMMNAKDKEWRKDTIILMDNAPYHSSKIMMDFYELH